MNYPRQFLVCVLLMCGVLFADASVDNGHFRLETTIIKKATLTTSELQTQANLSNPFRDIGSIEVENHGREDRTFIVRIKIRSTLIDNGQTILADATTIPGVRPLTVQSGGSARYTFNTYTRNDIQVLSSLSEPEAKQKLRRYTSTLQTGMIPDNELRYEVILYDVSDTSFSSPLITLNDTIIYVLEDGHIEIQMPDNRSSIRGDLISFMWEAIHEKLRNGANVTYTLYFSNIPNFDINNARYQVSVKNTALFNMQRSQLEREGLGDEIYWKIRATDDTGAVVGLTGMSPEYTFTIDRYTVDDLTKPHSDYGIDLITPAYQTPFTSSDLAFKWSPVNEQVRNGRSITYTIYFSNQENVNAETAAYTIQDANISGITILQDRLIRAGLQGTVYWKVTAIADDGNYIGESTPSMIILSDESAYDGTVAGDTITEAMLDTLIDQTLRRNNLGTKWSLVRITKNGVPISRDEYRALLSEHYNIEQLRSAR